MKHLHLFLGGRKKRHGFTWTTQQEALVLESRKRKHKTILQQPWRDHIGWCWLALYEEPQSEWLARPRGHRHSGSQHFKARHVFTVRMVERGRATACLRRDNSSGTLGKMIQSVRLARQRALFLLLCRLFVFVQRFTRPVSVPNCLSSPTQIWSCCRGCCTFEAYSGPII